ncbi:heterogeneous nuclear ribonucleoprotein L-like [Ochlerotatus camptorhynchus]|uniref:heterogeneous nuclear ribonucleoprotein L-like n=1 Tax=Ochlerotatus camptorhynchus TaxID=644619 RepID=UPI0031D3620A
MKDAPLTRNGPANFIQPAQQQGAVMMVYGLDNNTSNTEKLFNLFCLYGNVVRIKFLKSKEGTAMGASKNNRFLSLTQASKNCILPPSKILHFFDTAPVVSEDLLLTAFSTKGCHPSQCMKLCFSSSKTMNGAWSNEWAWAVPGNQMSAAAATASVVAAASCGVTPISVTGDCLKSEHDEPM